MANNPLEYYIDRYQQGIITKEELVILHGLLQQPENQNALEELMHSQLQQWEDSDLDLPGITEQVQRAVAAKINTDNVVQPVHRVHFLRTAWFRYAAAILLLLGAATFFWLRTPREKPPVIAEKNDTPANDIVPRMAAPVLRLADGTTIVLDSTANGNLANQGNVRIMKGQDGRLEYIPEGLSSGRSNEVLYNTISTPPGTQYQLRLSDGTRVWLNVASSITYPAIFTGNERDIKITGEAYFEVAHDAQKPFTVKKGDIEITVLGTHFNVNTYDDEPDMKVTLLEGSVRVTDFTSPVTKKSQPATILKPGQQAAIARNNTIETRNRVDLDAVMSWKNGLFNFNNAHLEDVMRELARWYDIEVIYENGPPQVQFMGKISRDLSLSQVLNGLKGTGFNFKITEGRKLIITP